nr:unnamed protein product [Callosobruchus chinensis]
MKLVNLLVNNLLKTFIFNFFHLQVHPDLKYLTTLVELGIQGVSKNFGLQELTDYEQCMLDNAVTCLAADITKGEKYAGPQSECPRAKTHKI